jgi:hypothetical protein
MNPRVVSAFPNDNFTLTLLFENQEKKCFDVTPYLSYGIFQELQQKALFKTVKVWDGTVQWKNGQDFCPDTLYLKSKPL